MISFLAAKTPSDRLLGWLIALCGLLMISTRIPRIIDQIPVFSLWWTVLAALPVGAVALLAVCGRLLPLSVLRMAWAFSYITLALALLFVFLAYRGPDTQALLPWVWSLEASVICFPILLLKPRYAVVAGLALPVLPLISAIVFLREVPAEILAQTPIHLGNIAFLVIFLGIRTRLSQLTHAEGEARRQLSEQQQAELLAIHQRELARTIHDEVLSVLTAAARLPGQLGPELRRETLSAVAVLDSRTPPPANGDWTYKQFISLLRAGAESIASDAVISTPAAPNGSIPAPAGTALISAAREALRNSKKHSVDGANIAIRVEASTAQVTVIVEDDGPGFDLASIPAARLGVASSILERVNEIPGGRATIHPLSDPSGTRVELIWSAI